MGNYESIKKLRELFNTFNYQFNNRSDVEDSIFNGYIECIKEVGNLKTNEAIDVLKEIRTYYKIHPDVYLEIILALDKAINKFQIQEKDRQNKTKAVTWKNINKEGLINWRKDFQSQLYKQMNELPISSIELSKDIYGRPIDQYKIFKTIKDAYYFILDFFICSEKKVTGFRNPEVQSRGDKEIRAIYFYERDGETYFDGVHIARISEHEYILKFPFSKYEDIVEACKKYNKTLNNSVSKKWWQFWKN